MCQRGGSQNRNQFEGWGCIWKPAKLLSANFELGPRSIGLETKNLELAGPVFLREVVQVLAGHLGKGGQWHDKLSCIFVGTWDLIFYSVICSHVFFQKIFEWEQVLKLKALKKKIPFEFYLQPAVLFNLFKCQCCRKERSITNFKGRVKHYLNSKETRF